MRTLGVGHRRPHRTRHMPGVDLGQLGLVRAPVTESVQDRPHHPHIRAVPRTSHPRNPTQINHYTRAHSTGKPSRNRTTPPTGCSPSGTLTRSSRSSSGQRFTPRDQPARQTDSLLTNRHPYQLEDGGGDWLYRTCEIDAVLEYSPAGWAAGQAAVGVGDPRPRGVDLRAAAAPSPVASPPSSTTESITSPSTHVGW